MERSSRKLIVFFLFFLATFSARVECDLPYCNPKFLADMASDCVGGLDKPRLPCCVMVIASVGMGYGEPEPCVCLVVREPAFLATGLSIHSVFSMYPICHGVHPVGPYTPDPCSKEPAVNDSSLSAVKFPSSAAPELSP